MKRLLATAALAAALSCSAAGTQDIQKHGEEYFRIFSILPDGQGILARRCTKLTQSPVRRRTRVAPRRRRQGARRGEGRAPRRSEGGRLAHAPA